MTTVAHGKFEHAKWFGFQPVDTPDQFEAQSELDLSRSRWAGPHATLKLKVGIIWSVDIGVAMGICCLSQRRTTIISFSSNVCDNVNSIMQDVLIFA